MTDHMTIDKMNREDWDYISSHLAQFNVNQSEGLSRKPGTQISLTLKEDGKIIGGINCKAIYMSLIIDHLWIAEERRGEGHGTRLVLEAENRAHEEGCISSQTSTYSFQAPEFYQKMGYSIIGVFEGYPNGIKKFYLGKDL